jgi:hypothetical protein
MVPATVISLAATCFTFNAVTAADDGGEFPSCASEVLVAIPQNKSIGHNKSMRHTGMKSFLVIIYLSSRFFCLHLARLNICPHEVGGL